MLNRWYVAYMKQLPALFLLILLQACVLFEPQSSHRKPSHVKVEIPPGTVWLRDNLFIDQHEIANEDYMEFLGWLQRKNKSMYLKMLPDTIVWRDTSYFNEPFVHYYLKHSAYATHPVVGVSLVQSSTYCAWRSDRVNEMMFVRDWKIKYHPDSVYPFEKRVIYRLPIREEWEYAAQAGLPYERNPIGYDSLYRKNGAIMDNLYSQGIVSFGVPMPVHSYWKNNYNLYHMLGNVSELTSDSMIKGLNFLTQPNGESKVPDIRFQHEADTLANIYTTKSYMRYKKPASWLGFRCVCEVLR